VQNFKYFDFYPPPSVNLGQFPNTGQCRTSC